MTTIVYTPGVCRVCGCTDLSPCILAADGSFGEDEPGILNPCAWIDRNHTVCSNLKCIASIPLDELVKICAVQLAAAAGAR